MKQDITKLFIYLDDFCIAYDVFLSQRSICDKPHKKPTRIPCLTMSEIMTIMVLFQYSAYKNFKSFYLSYLQEYKQEFPMLPSYNRFIELQQRCGEYFSAFLMMLCRKSEQTGIYYIDSTRIPVCHHKRTHRHQVFKDLAHLGKSTMGWFFRFKLHLVINEKGELMEAQLTPGNVDDRKPVQQMVHRLKGLLLADKGYIDQVLFQNLFKNGIQLVTGLRKNMKNKLMPLKEKVLLKKRSIIETVNGVLKNEFQLVHTRHRSSINGFIHIVSTLVAYALKDKKPSIKWD